jgi:4-amino-4-deoxy-L-arabinose transferase-like glycosyltransferase
VTETTAPIVEKTQSSTAARIGWAVLIVATLYVCYFSHLGAIGFVGPDEPRYAWIARDMAETGDWVTPRLYGKPWFEKPPLFYWGGALSFKLFGVSEAAARLPSAVSALLATLALAWLALRLYGAETARWLLLLLPTTVGMIGFSHAAATDMPFSGMLTIAMVCAAVALGLTRDENTPILPRTPWLALLLFGFFLGLAVLAKGPAAIVLSGGAVFFWALLTKRWRDAFRLFHPVALASFCLTALPWYVTCAQRNPDFFRVFIIEHNFKRYLTPEFQHIQPFWFYIPVILVTLLPWSGALLGVLSDVVYGLRNRRWIESKALFLAAWVLCPLVFFSFSRSKLPGYILPALPPIATLIAQSLSFGVQRSVAVARWVGISVAILLMAPAGVLWYFVLIRPTREMLHFNEASLLWASLCAFAGLIALILALRNRSALTFFTAVLVLLISLAALRDSSIERSTQGLSVRSSVQAARSHWTDFDPSKTSSFKLSRGNQYGLNFYMRREVPVLSEGRRESGWVFGTKNLGGDSWTTGMDCIFVTNVDSASQPVVCKDRFGGPSAGGLPRSGEAQ